MKPVKSRNLIKRLFRPKNILSALLLLIPAICFADGGVRAVGLLMDMLLFGLYGFTALAAFLFVDFFLRRYSPHRLVAILIAIPLAFIGLFILFIIRDYLLLGYTILIPNLLILLTAPWIKASPQLEAILGRIDEDRNFIIWVKLRRNTSGQIEVTYRQVLDKNRIPGRNFYSLVDLGNWVTGGNPAFSAHQEAIDYLRSTHHLPELKFVKRGNLQPEYLKLLAAERKEN